MPEAEQDPIVAITDNSQAGKIVVRRAIRLGAMLNMPVDIHHILDIPNGHHITSELIDHSLDELIHAEQELRQVLHDSNDLKSAHAAVEAAINENTAQRAFITFLTEEIRQKLTVSGIHYLAFPDSQKQLDLEQVALLCGHNSNQQNLAQLAQLMRSTGSNVKLIMEEVGIAFWNDLLGDLGLTDLPVESYRDEKSLNRIIRNFKPSMICLPSEVFNGEKIEWIRKIHPMDVLLY